MIVVAINSQDRVVTNSYASLVLHSLSPTKRETKIQITIDINSIHRPLAGINKRKLVYSMHLPFPDHCPFWCKMACASQNNNNKKQAVESIDQSCPPAPTL
jgi:hypothetical protein